jgi:hypothetical protein
VLQGRVTNWPRNELNVELSEREEEERMMGFEPTTFCMASTGREMTGNVSG